MSLSDQWEKALKKYVKNHGTHDMPAIFAQTCDDADDCIKAAKKATAGSSKHLSALEDLAECVKVFDKRAYPAVVAITTIDDTDADQYIRDQALEIVNSAKAFLDDQREIAESKSKKPKPGKDKKDKPKKPSGGGKNTRTTITPGGV